jgi:hypothetical protein
MRWVDRCARQGFGLADARRALAALELRDRGGRTPRSTLVPAEYRCTTRRLALATPLRPNALAEKSSKLDFSGGVHEHGSAEPSAVNPASRGEVIDQDRW